MCGARTSRINYTVGLISSRRIVVAVDACTVAVTRDDRTAGRISGMFARRLPISRKQHALKSALFCLLLPLFLSLYRSLLS